MKTRIKKTSEQLGLEALEMLSAYGTGNDHRRELMEIFEQSLMDLDGSRTGITKGYLAKLGGFLGQQNKLYDALDRYHENENKFLTDK